MGRLKSYEQRLEGCKNPLLKKLFKIIIEKKSNLCVAADFKTIRETLDFADSFGKHIVVLKVHTDIYKGASVEENLKLLYTLKKKHNFLLFEDRKFVDGTDTTKAQYANYVEYADIVTVVSVLGADIFNAIKEVADEANLPEDEPRGCFAVCEPSFANSQMPPPEEMLETAQRYSICVGIIAQKLRVRDEFSMIKASPGVHISKTGIEHSNQQWKHPSRVVGNGADLVIVGRGIISGPKEEMADRVLLYKEVCWSAYCDDLAN